MAAPFPPLRRRPSERLAAWLVTGPLGHLWSVVADLAVFGLRLLHAWGRLRLQRMVAGAGKRPSKRL